VWGMQVGHGRVGSIASLMVMKTSPESDWSLEGCFSIVVGDSRAGCDDASFTQESNLRIRIIRRHIAGMSAFLCTIRP
jgi:hypothetical protein